MFGICLKNDFSRFNNVWIICILKIIENIIKVCEDVDLNFTKKQFDTLVYVYIYMGLFTRKTFFWIHDQDQRLYNFFSFSTQLSMTFQLHTHKNKMLKNKDFLLSNSQML